MININKKTLSVSVIAHLVTVWLILILIISSTSCKTQPETILKEVPVQTLSQNRIVHQERIDTILVELPTQSSVVTTFDTISNLETDIAKSTARINPDGTLSHSLKNKQHKLPVPIIIPADTIYRQTYTEIPVKIEIEKPVERELTTWQKIRLKSWLPLALLLILIILSTLPKKLRIFNP